MKAAKRAILLVCLSVFVLLPTASPLHAQLGEEQVERVFRDWQKLQDRIQRIRYVVRGESVVPKGTFTDEMGKPLDPPQPDRDIAQKQDTICLLDIAGKRFRMEQDAQVYASWEKRLLPRLTTTVFDGQSSSTAIPRDDNARAGYVRSDSDPDVLIAKNDFRYRPLTAVNAYWLSPLLFAHGLIPQLTSAASFLDKLDIDDFKVHGRAVHEGIPCLVLRTFPSPAGQTTSFDEYWVDQSRDSIVVRHSSYMNDKLFTDVGITYQQTPHGWIPLRWVGSTRDYIDGHLINVTRLRIEEFTIEPEVMDADFRVEVKPGMVILEDDFEAPKAEQGPLGFQRKWYRVAPDGQWQEIDQQSGAALPQTHWLRWLALAGIAAAIALGYLLWRRLRAGPGRHNTAATQ
jgi:hypothetical protein